MSVRITFRGHERRGIEQLFLQFSVDEGRGQETASVLVNTSSSTVLFPHHLCSSGESFGPAIDGALAEHAEQIIATFEAHEAWAATRSSGAMGWAA